MSKEFALEIGDFDSPKELSGTMASAYQIINLLFLNPGTYPTSPEMGVGLDRYRFDILDSSTMMKINQVISSQISTYLPELASSKITLIQSEEILNIVIEINNEIIVARTKSTDNVIKLTLEKHNK